MSRSAVIEIDEQVLRALLDLPPDIRIGGIYEDTARGAVVVHVQGDRLPDVPRGEALPALPARVEQRRIEFEHGYREVACIRVDLPPAPHINSPTDAYDWCYEHGAVVAFRSRDMFGEDHVIVECRGKRGEGPNWVQAVQDVIDRLQEDA